MKSSWLVEPSVTARSKVDSGLSQIELEPSLSWLRAYRAESESKPPKAQLDLAWFSFISSSFFFYMFVWKVLNYCHDQQNFILIINSWTQYKNLEFSLDYGSVLFVGKLGWVKGWNRLRWVEVGWSGLKWVKFYLCDKLNLVKIVEVGWSGLKWSGLRFVF